MKDQHSQPFFLFIFECTYAILKMKTFLKIIILYYNKISTKVP